MKKILVLVPLLVLLAASCSSTGQQSSAPASSADQTPQAKYTVVYDGSKFTPATLTIKKGETVAFENQSSGGMSVASNPHPTHTDYPEFDQYKSSQRGQKTYIFTFEKVGTWGYHNHLNPAVKGTINVQ